MVQLILIRHGQSTWNALNRFTGWVDVPLNHVGRAEAIAAAQKLNPYQIDVCFTSLLIRAIETAVICLTEGEQVCVNKSPVLKHAADDPNWHGWDHYEGDENSEIPVFPSIALDERYYGDLQGLNKAQTAEKYGQDVVQQWRRSFSVRPPDGESLADAATRTLPFFYSRIMQHLKEGDRVLVSAHGNSLRSIIMSLEDLSEEAVVDLELATGVPIVYNIDPEGKAIDKVILQ